MLTECFNRDIEGGCIPECRACNDCKGKAYKLIDREHLEEAIHNYIDNLHASSSLSDSCFDIIIDTAFKIIAIINDEYAYTLYNDKEAGKNNEG